MTPAFRSDSDSLERVLGETGWLHGVASGLGYDAQAADDAVQETLIAALRFESGEPGSDGPGSNDVGRGWLRTVLRRRIGVEQRANARRLAREQSVARPEEQALDPSSALERIELTERLRRAIAELPRKEREVIALRFGAGLGPAEIAETLNETANAVSSRLSRSLSKLRRALDDEQDSHRQAHGFGLFSLLTATLMKKNVALLVVLAIVAGLTPLGLRALHRESAPAPIQEALEPELVAVTEHGEGQALAGPATEDLPAREIATSEALPGVPAVEEVAALAAEKGAVRVRVVEAVTGLPAPGVGLRLIQFHGGAFWDQGLGGITDTEGILEFEDVSPGPRNVYLSRVNSHGGFASERVDVMAGETAEVTSEVDPTSVARGRVVDEAGAPVAGARLWVGSGEGATSHGEFVASTDERGLFEIKYVGRTQFLSASAPGFAPSRSTAFGIGDPLDEQGRLRLILRARRGTVRGTVEDMAGAPIGGAMVTLGAPGRREAEGETPPYFFAPPMQIERTDELGAFEFSDAGVGEQPLQARVAGSGLWEQTVVVTDGGVLEVPIQLIPGGTVKGQVLDAEGAPFPGASVAVRPAVQGAMSRMEIRSGADGRYELRGVTPGNIEFQVEDGEWTRILRAHVLVIAGQATTWNPVLPERKKLRGRVLSESGKPLARWEVATNPVTDGVVSRVGTAAHTKSDGSFALFQDYGDLFQITIRAPGGYAYPVLTLDAMEIPDEERDYIVPDDLVPTAGAFGRIVNAEGQGVAATVDVSVGGSQPRNFEVRAAADGTFRIDYLSATTFELMVLAEGLPKQQVEVGSALVNNEIRDLGDIVLRAN